MQQIDAALTPHAKNSPPIHTFCFYKNYMCIHMPIDLPAFDIYPLNLSKAINEYTVKTRAPIFLFF
jgi:hypothetical protein